MGGGQIFFFIKNFVEFYCKEMCIRDRLQTTEQGLSEAEAARRLSEHGPNRLAAGKKKSNLQRFFEELKDPMILILLAAALISGITSDPVGESILDDLLLLLRQHGLPLVQHTLGLALGIFDGVIAVSYTHLTSASVISAICFFTRRMRTMEVSTATTAITMDKKTMISILAIPPY